MSNLEWMARRAVGLFIGHGWLRGAQSSWLRVEVLGSTDFLGCPIKPPSTTLTLR